MDTIRTSLMRVGNFTSSKIVALMSNGKAKGTLGKPAWTYIAERNMERNLQRPLENETTAKALSWGKLVEKRVFELLGTEYQLVSSETIMHPTIPFWSGSPDANKFDEGRTVGDIKSPLTLKSFCQLVAPLYGNLTGLSAIEYIRENHDDGDKFYWQLVSNAILTDSKYGELIVYVPYLSELEEIREMVRMMDDAKQYRYYWINNAQDDELPWLKEGGYYKNLNVIRFPIPQEDKDALTERVLTCGQYLDRSF